MKWSSILTSGRASSTSRDVAGLSLRDRVRSSDIWEELKVEQLLLHVERSQLRWFGDLVRMPPGHLPGEFFRHAHLGGDVLEGLYLSADLGMSCCPPRGVNGSERWRKSGSPLSNHCNCDLDLYRDKWQKIS